MIHGFSLETAHLLGDALPAMHRLRHKVFVERQRYDVPTYNGMEWDQFDTPAAIYLLWRDAEGEPRAVARLLPTTRRYMIEELWRDLIDSGGIPCQSNIWEATRFGVDRDLDAAQRKRALGELVCGCLEYGLQNGITEYLSVMPLHIIKRVLRGAGVIVNVLGSSKSLGGLGVFAVRIHVTSDGLKSALQHYGLEGSGPGHGRHRPGAKAACAIFAHACAGENAIFDQF